MILGVFAFARSSCPLFSTPLDVLFWPRLHGHRPDTSRLHMKAKHVLGFDQEPDCLETSQAIPPKKYQPLCVSGTSTSSSPLNLSIFLRKMDLFGPKEPKQKSSRPTQVSSSKIQTTWAVTKPAGQPLIHKPSG